MWGLSQHPKGPQHTPLCAHRALHAGGAHRSVCRAAWHPFCPSNLLSEGSDAGRAVCTLPLGSCLFLLKLFAVRW